MPKPLRPYVAGDRDALYDVCLRTGDSGGDATGLYAEGRLPGEVWVGPYVEFEPSLAAVLDDGSGAGGYVLGALDTRAFEARCEREWWPALRLRYAAGSAPEGTRDARVIALIHDPPVAPDHVVAEHPSHLHIDLLPHWQGGGWGRRLIEGLFDRLVAAGSPGVHLGVGRANTNAIGFYGRMGFTVLDDSSPDALFLGHRL